MFSVLFSFGSLLVVHKVGFFHHFITKQTFVGFLFSLQISKGTAAQFALATKIFFLWWIKWLSEHATVGVMLFTFFIFCPHIFKEQGYGNSNINSCTLD